MTQILKRQRASFFRACAILEACAWLKRTAVFSALLLPAEWMEMASESG